MRRETKEPYAAEFVLPFTLHTSLIHSFMQWDMFVALCGAIASQLILTRWHERQLASMK